MCVGVCVWRVLTKPLIARFENQLTTLNPLKAQLNSICHFLALLGAHYILHISR
jgi:hypothetical protein